LAENFTNSYQNTSAINKKFFASWFSKKEEKAKCSESNKKTDNTCQQIPESTKLPKDLPYVDTGAESKCADKGFGK
jgi:hypothetical protein